MRHIPTPLGLKEGRERLAEFPRGRALRAFIHSSRRSLKASCGPGCPAHWGWRPFKGRGCSHSSKRSRMTGRSGEGSSGGGGVTGCQGSLSEE